MIKRWFYTMMSVLLISAMFSGCSKKDVKVGICFPDHVTERWVTDKNILIKELHKQGAATVFRNANKDATRQYKQAVRLLESGIDVLIIAPVNKESAKAIVKKAHEKDVKVIAYDRIINNCKLDYYVSFDYIDVGERQARYLTKINPKGKYAVIGGSVNDNNAHLVRFGQFNILQPLIYKQDIEVVYDEFCNRWSEEEGFSMMEECLTNNKDIVGVLAANDNLAKGAIKALKKHGLSGKVLVSGQDADLAACRRIVNGTQTMTVFKPLESIAHAAAELAVKVANKEDVKVMFTINNGDIPVPSVISSQIFSVHKNNIKETVVFQKFHSEKEIYN